MNKLFLNGHLSERSWGTSQLALGQGAAKKVLTPQQIFRDGVHGDTRIEFKVEAVTITGSPFAMEEATNRQADAKSAVSRLRVILSEKVEAEAQSAWHRGHSMFPLLRKSATSVGQPQKGRGRQHIWRQSHHV